MSRIRCVSNYASSERLASEIERQFKPIEGFTPNWTFGDDYDLLFIFNDWGEVPAVPKERIYVMAQEPTWSDNYRDWNGKCAEFVAPVNGNYPLMFYHHGLSWQEVEAINPVKTKKLSFVCAKGPEGIPGTLYEKRNELVKALIESDLDIDIYGRGWDFDSPKYKGPLERKADGLIDYEYSICCENSCEGFYRTEKYHDIVSCKSRPIDVTFALYVYNPSAAIGYIKLCLDKGIDDLPKGSCDGKIPPITYNNILNYIHSKVRAHE